MINFGVQIYNPMETNALMSNVDQGNGILEPITFKKGLLITKDVVHFTFTNDMKS
jgi:hypothetical protein